jgi:putative ABC transport system ATP-binding protein
MPRPVLALEEVEAKRGGSFRLLVRHFAVASGEAVAIVGRSGSGKSTCLDVMAGILRPARVGRFEICPDGEAAISVAGLWGSPDQVALRELRGRRLGYVLQTGGLVPFLSIAANVELPLRRMDRRDQARVAALLDRLGVTVLEARRPREVSIGQRQRAAVARALAHAPAVVLADEPTASLDPDTAEAVMGVLRDSAAREGAALIVVTHDRDLAQRHGFRVAACVSAGEPGFSVLDDRVPPC